jgi:hypothetical protein
MLIHSPSIQPFKTTLLTRWFIKSMIAAATFPLLEDKVNLPAIHWTTPVSKLIPSGFVLANPKATVTVTI